MQLFIHLTLFLLSLTQLARSAPAARSPTSSGYGTITTTRTGPAIRTTINNAPINVFDYKLATDLTSLVSSLPAQPTAPDPPKVIVFSSANPDFFIAHYNIHALSAASPEQPPGNNTLVGVDFTSAVPRSLPSRSSPSPPSTAAPPAPATSSSCSATSATPAPAPSSPSSRSPSASSSAAAACST